MRKTIYMAVVLLIVMTSVCCASGRVASDGYYKGIKLCGRVKIVEYNADIKVKVVNSFQDLKVQVVSCFPDRVGKWQFVDSFPDFTIQFVEAFEDISIKYVEAFPGI